MAYPQIHTPQQTINTDLFDLIRHHRLQAQGGLKSALSVNFKDCFFSFATDKFKGGRAELNQGKSCIDLDELMELLKARGTEK